NGRCVVKLQSGERIVATPVNVTAKGQGTMVSVRPERVEYMEERMPEGAFTIDAEVLEFIYMGDIFRTRLKVAGTDDFVIKNRNTIGQRRLEPGEIIKIGWAPQDARALDPM
ncbi:MAG: TOBE domain-containing protein, partial [Paracoccaceae bacterium]|nr:TOBE domain-containing protein [Paracoccaceae bacterium]